VTDNRRAVLAWLIGIAACVAVILRTEFTADMSAFLPRTPSPQQQILVEQLREGALSRVILVGVEEGSAAARLETSRRMAAALRDRAEFVSVDNGEALGTEKDQQFLWRNRYLLSAGVTPAAFTADGLRAHLEEDLQVLASASGMLVRRTLASDPTRELLRMLENVGGQARPATEDGLWTSSDGGRALLLAQTRASVADIDAQAAAIEAVHSAFGGARQENVRLVVSGPPVFAVQTRARIEDDALRLSIVATVLIASMLLYLYRSLRVLGLGLLPVASGALAGIAAVGLAFGSVHGITLAFGITLLGEGVDYAVYFFTQTSGRDRRSDFQRIWPTIRLGVLTSICGFSAMLFSGFTGLAQLGVFSVVGLIAAAGVTRLVLPALVPADFTVQPPQRLSKSITALAARGPSLRWILLALAVAAAVLLGSRAGSLWSDDIAALSPVPADLQRLDQQLRQDLGAADARYLVIVSGASDEEALQRSERVADVLQEQVAAGRLQGFESAASYLPSATTQQARQEALPDAAALRSALRKALQGLPFRSETFEPFVADVAAAKQAAPVGRAELAGTRLGQRLDSLLVRRGEGVTALVFLRGVADASALSAALAPLKGASLLDMRGESEQMARSYRAEALEHALLGAAAIVVLLFFALRSASRVLRVLLPLAAAVLLTLGILVASGVSLSLFHLIGLLLVVAVGSNYSLFFEQQREAGDAEVRMLVSLAFANISTVCGFGVLAFSSVPVLQALGISVGAGALLALVSSAILIPPRRAL
jgi:predicted exporter